MSGHDVFVADSPRNHEMRPGVGNEGSLNGKGTTKTGVPAGSDELKRLLEDDHAMG